MHQIRQGDSACHSSDNLMLKICHFPPTKTLILLEVELLENGTSDLYQILQEDSPWHCPGTGRLKNYIFQNLTWPPTKTRILLKNWITSKRFVRFPPILARRILLPPSTYDTQRMTLQQKLKNLNEHNLKTSILQYSERTTYGGVLEMSANLWCNCMRFAGTPSMEGGYYFADGFEHSYVTAINHCSLLMDLHSIRWIMSCF